MQTKLMPLFNLQMSRFITIMTAIDSPSLC